MATWLESSVIVVAFIAAASLRSRSGGAKKVVPSCSYVAAYMRRNPDTQDLLARVASPVLPWLCVPSGVKREWMSSDDTFAHQSDRFEKLLSSIDLGDISVTAHIERVSYHLQGIVLAQEDDA